MKLKSLIRSAALAGGLAITALPALANGFLIVDILPIRDGKSVADAEAYFAEVEPIFAKYGMTRSDSVLQVIDIPRGNVDAQVINLWQTPNPKAAFEGIFSDKTYKTHVENRDAIFDMPAATVVVTQRKVQ